MSSSLSISIALIVFMGLASGGMLALVLMTTRRYQLSFSVVLALVALLAVGGVFASVSAVENLAQGLANAVVLLILSFALGYTLTTFSVLSYSTRRSGPLVAGSSKDFTAVILLGRGEPPEYGVESASRRLALADDPQDVPPVLLRPFYLRDLRSKYAHTGPSPYRESYIELASKVQSRLGSSYRVYSAFYSDHPSLSAGVAQAIEEGANAVLVVHVRVTNPPDPVLAGDLYEGVRPENYRVKLVELGPLWDSDLLPQIYVRRVLEAVPQVSDSPEDVGILLVGRGHVAVEGAQQSSTTRYNQELSYQRKVRQALVKMGFDESRVAIGWLRSHGPKVPEALNLLVAAGCKSVLWMPSTFPADGVNTLHDIPTQLEAVARERGIKLMGLGAWNADDLAAEEITARVRAVSEPAPRPVVARSF